MQINFLTAYGHQQITMTQKDTNTWIYFLIALAFTLIIGTGLYFSYQVQKINAKIENINMPKGAK